MYLNDTDSGWALVTRPPPTEETVSSSDGTEKILLIMSLIRIVAYVFVGIISWACKSHRKWFAPLFSLEALAQAIVFLYEFLFVYENLHEAETFCNFLVMLMQYINIVLVIAYMWAIYYFVFERKKEELEPFAVLSFSALLVIAAAATIASAVQAEESVCVSRAHIGWAWDLMVVGSIAEFLALPLLVIAFRLRKGKRLINTLERWETCVALIIAIAVRVPNIIQSFHSVPPHVQIFLRALPLVFPIAFLILLIVSRR